MQSMMVTKFKQTNLITALNGEVPDSVICGLARFDTKTVYADMAVRQRLGHCRFWKLDVDPATHKAMWLTRSRDVDSEIKAYADQVLCDHLDRLHNSYLTQTQLTRLKQRRTNDIRN